MPGFSDVLSGSPAFKYAQQTTQWLPVGSLADVQPSEVFHGCGGVTNICVVTDKQDAQGSFLYRPTTLAEVRATQTRGSEGRRSRMHAPENADDHRPADHEKDQGHTSSNV
jgi:hypothetical protein